MVKLYRGLLVDVVLACIFASGFTETTGFWHVALGVLCAVSVINVLLGAFLMVAYTVYGIKPPNDR